MGEQPKESPYNVLHRNTNTLSFSNNTLLMIYSLDNLMIDNLMINDKHRLIKSSNFVYFLLVRVGA